MELRWRLRICVGCRQIQSTWNETDRMYIVQRSDLWWALNMLLFGIGFIFIDGMQLAKDILRLYLLNCRNSETGLSLLPDYASGMTCHSVSERSQVLSLSSELWRLTFQSFLSFLNYSFFLSWLARGASSLSIWRHIMKRVSYHKPCLLYRIQRNSETGLSLSLG